MTAEKDVLPPGHARQEDVEQEPEDHHPSRLRTQHFDRTHNHRLIVGQDPLDVKPELQHLRQVIERPDERSSACTQHQQADDRLDRSHQHLAERFVQDNKTDKCDHADQHGRRPQEVPDELEY